jgi:hypothetical protein
MWNQTSWKTAKYVLTYMEHALQTDIKWLEFWGAPSWHDQSATLVSRELSHNALTIVWLIAIQKQKVRGWHMSAKNKYTLLQGHLLCRWETEVHFHLTVYDLLLW